MANIFNEDGTCVFCDMEKGRKNENQEDLLFIWNLCFVFNFNACF